jgi:NADH dehydrogenase/NADH:ubiquinone oxidoreductase subunit G
VGPRPTALDGLGLVVRTDPGRLATCTDPLTDALDSAQAAAVLWDEGDLAFDPDAARRLARLIADRPGARQLELAAEVNGAGLRALGIPSDRMLEDARGNRVGTLVAVHAEPRSWLGGHELEAALGRVGPIVAIASHRSELTDRAAVILPAATHYEQEGVLVSTAGRAQRLRPGVTSPKGTSPAWEILLGLSHRIGKPLPYRTARQVFDGVASRGGAFAGMSYDAMGVHGARIGAQARVPVQMETSPPEGDGLVLVPCPSIFGDVPSSRSDALRAVLTSPEAVVSSVDAERIGLNGDQHVRISSVQGELRLPVRTDPAVRVGSVLVTVGRPGASGAEALLAFDRRPIRVSVARA